MKKNIAFIVVLLFAVGLSLSAKEKAISPKKFKTTDIGNPELAGTTVTGNDKNRKQTLGENRLTKSNELANLKNCRKPSKIL